MAEDASDPRDYILDLSSTSHPQDSPPPASPAPSPSVPAGRPFLSIHFKCCNAYARIYKTADGQAYAGHCPKCARPARIPIGPGGATARFFTAE